MKYYYSGVTRQKEQVSGAVDAVDEVEARIKLRAMQIRPTKLSQRKSAQVELSFGGLKQINLGPPIDLKGMMVFTRQFSSLIDSGVPVVQCLDILWQQERRRVFKQILGTVKSDIEGGSGLAQALSRHPSAFNNFFVRIVEAGEISGTLDTALRRVGVQLEKLGRLKAKVVSALMYPIITVVVAVIVLIFLLVKVIPEVAKLYAESNAKLPELTIAVLEISQWFQDNWFTLIAGIAGGGFAFSVLIKVPKAKEVIDPILLRVPLFGPLIKKSMIARFTRTLSTLIASGVPLLQCFEICTTIITNTALKRIIGNTANMVQEGKTIAQGLASGGVFPPMVLHMVNIGEMTGKLDELLGKIADIFDDEVDDAIGNLTGILQPALIVGVGLIIAFLLISMYLPIFQLAEKVTGGAG